MLLRNVGLYLPFYTASKSKTTYHQTAHAEKASTHVILVRKGAFARGGCHGNNN
jgi:hypothetical protein